ncbi:MAG: flavin reductase family protein [Phycisphaerales bacterium]|nr:flavin reductase family protein [Phycisphaerales bacterium]
MFLDVEAGARPWVDVYRLCIGFITPRPIALVSTISPRGVSNLAPFSFYNMVSGNPPVVLFCPTQRRTGTAKDTLRNVKDTGEFVIATVTVEIAPQMVRCAADLPYGQSEFDFGGLTPRPATKVRPPLVNEAVVNMECRLRQIITTGSDVGGGNIVLGDVLAIHVDERILDERGLVDPRKLPTVGRLGGAWYCTVTDPYELEIPKV